MIEITKMARHQKKKKKPDKQIFGYFVFNKLIIEVNLYYK